MMCRHEGLEAGLVELHGLSHRLMSPGAGGGVKWAGAAVFPGTAAAMTKIEASPPPPTPRKCAPSLSLRLGKGGAITVGHERVGELVGGRRQRDVAVPGRAWTDVAGRARQAAGHVRGRHRLAREPPRTR